MRGRIEIELLAGRPFFVVEPMAGSGVRAPFTLLIDGLETLVIYHDRMAKHPPRRAKRSQSQQKPTSLWLVGSGTFAIAFAGASYALAPNAPGKAELHREWSKRTTDQHYSGCDQARANNHEDIASWEPSYRDHMDGDGDGLACEPYR